MTMPDTPDLPPLPVDAVIPALRAALSALGRAVLQAPPGAGKTTRVPLAMLDAVPGRIILLEPRRIAARAAAGHMAALLGEDVGARVGYRIRGDSAVSPATRIEVVTEGILTRMLQADPALDGVGLVIFDEFHERSLQADLGLALAWEARAVLRPDLRLLVMSATLDAAPVAALLDDAPILTAEARAHPVQTRWLDRPQPPAQRFIPAAADLVRRALAETEGGVLVFLPGEGEIRRLARALDGALPQGAVLHMLFGAMPLAAQRATIARAPKGQRKVVLATAIAETSLTIEDVRVVVDCGRARRARFDPATAMSRLVTDPVSRAEADQRRGRAGRVAPGVCYRMWARAQEGALPAYAPPEIEAADLAGLALDLAQWGSDADALRFLTPPPAPALAEARALLASLGALDGDGRITAHGRAMAALPLHPRLAHMLLVAGRKAAPLAALLSGRDPLRGAPADLALRLAALSDPGRFGRDHPWTPDRAALEAARAEARRLARLLPGGGGKVDSIGPGAMAALAYPDRVGLRRRGDDPRFVLSGGRGAVLASDDPLAAQRLIVATDLDGTGREARIRQAAALSEAELRALFADNIGWHAQCTWSRRDRRVEARQQERFGALVLNDRLWRDAPPDAIARAAADGIRDLGLPLPDPAQRLIARVELLRARGVALPDMSETALLAGLEHWLGPWLGLCRDEAAIRALDPMAALEALLSHEQRQSLERLAPPVFVTPLGRRIPIDYAAETPSIALRLQELFGVTVHPVIGPDRVPLRIVLLSPARRPVQVTTDLPGFWRTSYADVRKEMRGRYPRHPWPEDPTQADPTLRARQPRR